MKRILVGCLAGSLAWLGAAGAWADPPPAIDYQGKILVNDIPLTGDGYFKYAISDAAATTNYWSQDGTATGEPTGFVTNECYNGVFSVALGASPMTAIDPDIFAAGVDLELRVWFSSDGVTFNEMLPSQELLSSPYAINADQVDGYDAADLIAAAQAGLVETDPVFSASAAAGISGGDILDWDTAYGWGDHATNGYLTAESDPVFSASVAAGISAADTQNWTTAYGWGDHAAAGYAETNDFTDYAAVTGLSDADITLWDDASDWVTDYGDSRTNWDEAFGWGDHATNGYLTAETDPVWTAASTGYYQKTESDARYVEVAGDTMTGALAIDDSVSGTLKLDSTWTNIAVGAAASAAGGSERIAIGHEVTNDVNNTARMRGAFYMDGGDSVWARSTFGTGSFKKLLPLPDIQNIIYVATNGSPSGPGTIDRPFDTPQNGYNHAATVYPSMPVALVIASGQYPGLNMNAGHIHVFGESRCELVDLMVSSASTGISGKQRVENIIVLGTTTVAVDGGSDVKFHNCRMEGSLLIYGPRVEVQDCYVTGLVDGLAVAIGNGASPISGVALTQSSFYNDSGMFGTVQVNPNVLELEILGCQVRNKGGGPCIDDQEPGPIMPTHLYTHNYIHGAAPTGASTPAVQDASVVVGPTITFTHNLVMGHVGVFSNSQFYANNTVYGLINNVGGIPGWAQAGLGTGADAAGNIEHEITYPVLPTSWLD